MQTGSNQLQVLRQSVTLTMGFGSLLVVLWGIAKLKGIDSGYWGAMASSEIFFSGGFFLLGAYLLHREWRWPAMLWAATQLIELLIWLIAKPHWVLMIRLITLLVYTRGTIALWDLARQGQNCAQRAPRARPFFKIAALILFVPMGLGVLAISVFGTLCKLGYGPPLYAVHGTRMSAFNLKKLREAGLLGEHEPIIYYYSDAVVSVLGEGNFFTPHRVVTYLIGKEYYEEARFDEIETFSYELNAGDAWLWILTHEGSELVLNLSGDAKHDRAFVNTFDARLREVRRLNPIVNSAEEHADDQRVTLSVD